MPDSKKTRLDSWKEIAEYLGRDLRTVARWEKEHVLPVHRVGGTRGKSVFAFTEEIDAWLARDCLNTGEAESGESTVQNRPPIRTIGGIKTWLVVLAALASTLAVYAWIHRDSGIQIARISSSQGKLVAYSNEEKPLWTYVLPPNPTISLCLPYPALQDLEGDGRKEVLACLEGSISPTGERGSGGELLCFTNSGSIRWRYLAKNTLRFGATTYDGPWPSKSWTLLRRRGRTLLALAVHHFTWWPSILAVLDSNGRVLGEFVNSGWILIVQPIETPSGPLFFAGGISNSRDAGMLAVIDPDNAGGSSPEEPGSTYNCGSCPPGRPLRYFVFPRSELNRMTPSQYNRVYQIDGLKDRITIHTEEITQQVGQVDSSIDAIYEFTPDLHFRKAYFNDRYWDLHRKLEREGKINHSREQCPEREGPLLVQSWSREEGWKDIHLH